MASQSSGNIIASPQTITGSWADLGGEIESEAYSYFAAYLQLDINNSTGVQFRFVGLHTTGGAEYYLPTKIIKNNKTLLINNPYEVNNESDQNLVLETETDMIIPIIKLQVKASTVGATAGIITTAVYRQGYRQ